MMAIEGLSLRRAQQPICIFHSADHRLLLVVTALLAERAALDAQLSLIGPDNPILRNPEPVASSDAPDRWIRWVDHYIVASAALRCSRSAGT